MESASAGEPAEVRAVMANATEISEIEPQMDAIPKTSVRGYMPHLDGLRALAVTAVMATHWLPDAWQFGLPLATGVQLFFVLSGFLITGILLDSKQGVGFRCNRRAIRNFYARRFLRIFPLYYVVLAIAAAFAIPHLRETLWWHLSYLSNFCFYIHPGFGTEIGHFWSLAVEEQFYLMWPCVIMLLPGRWLWWAILAAGLCGPTYRLLGALFSPIDHFYIGTPGSFDSLALGAGLALGVRSGSRIFARVMKFRWVIAALAVGVFGVVHYGSQVPRAVDQCLSLLLISILYGVMIYEGSIGFRGWLGRVFELGVIRYTGRISYGLYVMHNFASIPTMALLREFPILKQFPANILIMNTVLTFGFAALSWHLYESRLNALKRYFP
jgi:peptidoglycan/LPS O-acetylase OafA/YrhL